MGKRIRGNVSIPLGTINTIRKQTGKSIKHVSIPLGTINTLCGYRFNKPKLRFNSTRYN